MKWTRLHTIGAIVIGLLLAATVAAVAIWSESKHLRDENAYMQPVVRAVFADERLWLLLIDGTLASMSQTDSTVGPVALKGKVQDICKSKDRLIAVVTDADDRWLVQEHSSGDWSVKATISADGEVPVALACPDQTDQIIIVTNRRLVTVQEGGTRSVRLAGEVQSGLVNAVAFAEGGKVWVGLNAGEWGGGLWRIDVKSGTVEAVERNRSGDLCGGPLNGGCDPVNGITSAPWDRSCVVAAIGLVHFMSHGRLIEVCDTDIRRIYFKPLAPQPPRGTLDDGEPSSTVAFYGLARSGRTVWAVGLDGLYGFSGEREPEFRPLPKFENRAGYLVSFEVPGVVLVMTGANQRAALSGSVPIMAVR